MLNSLNKLRMKGGSMEKEKAKKSSGDQEDTGEKKLPGFLKVVSPQTAVWVGATVVFAALFFASSVLDMKVHVTFGGSSTGTVNSQVSNPGSATPSGSDITSQVGGC